MWYVLQVSTGSEQKICKELQKLSYLALAPRENCMLRRGGKWVLEERILFHSYVFVNLTFNAQNYYRVKEIPNIIKFLGNGKEAAPLSYLEADYIKLLGMDDKLLPPSKVEYKEDGSVNIISGILLDFPKDKIKFDRHKRKAFVTIDFKDIAQTIELSIEPIESDILQLAT